MPRINYRDYRPTAETRRIIEHADEILTEYAADDYDLSVRQLYYQFISRDLFPDSYEDDRGVKNNMQSYNKLGNIIARAREAGMLDWNHIVDRVRELERYAFWDDPEDFISSVTPQFACDLWEGQDQRVEVWVEKDALSDVVGRACDPLRIPYMACKGYMSASAMWKAAQRISYRFRSHAQTTHILHLGDHDPSGINMSGDIQRRLEKFTRSDTQFTVTRIALTRAQVDEYNPPPNPAKETDPRFAEYEAVYGSTSWELDALDPSMLVQLITSEAQSSMDMDEFRARQAREQEWREQMERVATHWPRVEEFLDSLDWEEE